MNLTGVDKDELARGMVVTDPGALSPVSVLAVRLALLASASGSLAHDEMVKVHVGTAEAMARVSLLEGPTLAPGATAWTQLRLVSPVAVAVGDRLVVRRPSPSETLGGGSVADLSNARLRRRAETVAALERRAAPSPEARLLASLDVPRTPEEAGERSGLATAERDAAVASLVADDRVVPLGDALVARDTYEALATRVERTASLAHRRSPLRPGAPREEVRSSLALAAKRFNALVSRMVAERRIVERGNALALPSHVVTLGPEAEARWSQAREALARDPLQPPSPAALASEHGVDQELLVALAERGDLVRVSPDAVFLPEAVASFAAAVIDALERERTITVSRARDLTGSSRKHVVPLLQFLDDHGLTRRVGDDRVLVLAPPQARERIGILIRRREGQTS